jgi:6-phospho-3-hexuloisomerase
MKYPELVSAVLEENRKVLAAVSAESVDQLIEEILKAKSVHLYAMGRMQLSVRAFAMRLTHMGIPTYVVFDTTSRRIGPGDLLIGHCAVTNVELNVVRLSKEAGARIALLTAHPENEHGKLADLCVHVPGQIFGGPNEVKSIPTDGFAPRADAIPLHRHRCDASHRAQGRFHSGNAGKPYELRRSPQLVCLSRSGVSTFFAKRRS